MTGKSHDELHKWLHPYMELVDELKEVENPIQGKEVLGKIEASFAQFEQYFE